MKLNISNAEESIVNLVTDIAEINAKVQLFNYGRYINYDSKTMTYQYMVNDGWYSLGSGLFGFESGVEAKDNYDPSSGMYDYSLGDLDLKGSYSPKYLNSYEIGFYPQSKLGADGYPKIGGIPIPGHENLVTMDFGTTDSFAYLFSDTYAASPVMKDGGGLFQKTEDGYYEFDSAKNSAYYDSSQEKILIYDTPISPHYVDTFYTDLTNKQFGNFLPFNNPATSISSEYNEVDGIKYYKLDGSKYENWPDMWFGMTVEFDFYMPENGKWNGNDMVFEFDGDDDVLVYIDNVLALDVSGIHDPEYASLNFVTGEINDEATKYLAGGTPTTLKQRFVNAGYTQTQINELFNGNTFKDYTEHTLKFFYLERGSGFSYCHLKFNLPEPSSTVTVENKVEDASSNNNDDFEYQIELKDANGNNVSSVQYEDANGNFNELELTNGVGKFSLKADEKYTFSIPVGYAYKIIDLVSDNQYTTTWQGTADGTIQNTSPTEIIVTHVTIPKKSITINKSWNDNNNSDGTRPENITVNLLQNDIVIEEIEINANNSWQYVINDLDRYDSNNNEYIYTIEESAESTGYFVSSITKNDDVFTITNSRLGSLTINKKDSVTGEKLSNAIFELEKLNDNLTTWEKVSELTTNENGIANINNLTYGKYKLTEIRAPDGYSLSSKNTNIEFEITSEKFNYEMTIYNKQKVLLPEAGSNEKITIYISCCFLIVFLYKDVNKKFIISRKRKTRLEKVFDIKKE